MWKRIKRWIFPPKKNEKLNTTPDELVPAAKNYAVSQYSLENIEQDLKRIFQNSGDFQMEKVALGKKEALCCYLKTMTEQAIIRETVMTPLSQEAGKNCTIQNEKDLEQLRRELFAGIGHQYCENMHEVTWQILSGSAVLIVPRIKKALAVEVLSIEKRTVSEPSTQTTIRGPKDGFTDTLNTNLSLIRRRIKSPLLKFETMHIGKDSNTAVTIAYMQGVVNQDIVDEVRLRLNKIEASSILDSGNIEEFITDKTLTPFPLIYNTERPDSTAANILEGKVSILVDGSPFALVVPATITDFFSVSEDYYQPFTIGTFIRWIRYIAFFISLLLPALWVAVVTFHLELIPSPLLISIMAQRDGVPFPVIVELLMMEITFEVLREAGVRMPRAVGNTVSIVGALVIGQAAVEAGIVSNMMVIIVALTAISNFVFPVYSFASSVRLMRFLLAIAAAALGLYGVLLVLIATIAHMSSLRSFGVPYLAPMAPFIIEDQKDVMLRFPVFAMKKRPAYLNVEAPLKQPNAKSPTPPKKEGQR